MRRAFDGPVGRKLLPSFYKRGFDKQVLMETAGRPVTATTSGTGAFAHSALKTLIVDRDYSRELVFRFD
jgi:hypothetical protein